MLYAGFLISIFLEYVRPGSYWGIINAIKINSMIPLLVLVGVLFHKGIIDNKVFFEQTNSKLILFFLFMLAVSVLIADVTMTSYNTFKVVLGFVLWYYIIVRIIIDKDKIKGVFITFVVSHVVLLLLNPQVVLNPATRSYIHGNTFLGDGNDFSLSVCITMPMCFYLIQESKNKIYKALYILAMILLIFSIIGTQSRGATLALAAIFLYLWWVGRKKILGVIFIFSILGIVLSYAPPEYFNRINSIKEYKTEGSAQGRIIAWRTAVRMAKKYPLTGVGSGHFAVKLGTEFRPPEFGNENLPWLTAHSVYFLVIGELGVPGITCLLLLLIGNFLRNGRYIKEATNNPNEKLASYRQLFIMLNGSLIAFATAGAFLSVAYYPHLYIITGIFTAAQLMFEREKLAKQDSKPEKKSWYDDGVDKSLLTDDNNSSWN